MAKTEPEHLTAGTPEGICDVLHKAGEEERYSVILLIP